MRKIVVLLTLVMLSVTMVFTVAQEDISRINVNIDTDVSTSINTGINSDIVKNIEISDYYGMASLLINMHLELGRGVSDEEGIFYVVDLLNKMKYYAGLDIIDYLSYSFDVGKSLDSVLSDISNILEKSMFAKVELEKNLTSLKQKKLSCDGDKEVTDKNFSLALKDFDSKNMELNLDKSLDFASCALNSRIYYNVQDKILNYLDFYYGVLEKKYLYFRDNRSDIVANYPEILYNLSK